MVATRPASGTRGFVVVVGDTKQTFFCQPEGIMSGARGSPIEGDPSVWTCMTNDYLIDDRLTTGEPQACADLSLGGSIRSDITPTNDGGGLGDNGGGESVCGADDMSTRGWNKSTTPKDSQSSCTPLGVLSSLCPTGKYES